jgi:hypothetical protein
MILNTGDSEGKLMMRQLPHGYLGDSEVELEGM